MKKTILILSLALLSISAFSQTSTKPEIKTEPKKDTVSIPVYIMDRQDTVQVETLLYKGENGIVKYSSPGFYIRKGQVVKNEKGQLQWVEQPKIIGAFDSNKKPVKPI